MAKRPPARPAPPARLVPPAPLPPPPARRPPAPAVPPAVPPVPPVVPPTTAVPPPPVRPVVPPVLPPPSARPVRPAPPMRPHYIRVPIQAPGPMRPVGQTALGVMAICAVIGVIALFYGAFAVGSLVGRPASLPATQSSVAALGAAPSVPPPPADPCKMGEPERREHFLRRFQNEFEMCPP